MNRRGHGVQPPQLQLQQQVRRPRLVRTPGQPDQKAYFVAKSECLAIETWGKTLAHWDLAVVRSPNFSYTGTGPWNFDTS